MEKLTFHSFQHIPRISCKYGHFWTMTISFYHIWSVTHLGIKVTHWKIVNKFNHNSKNKNRKFDFSFGLAQWTSCMQIFPLLRGGWEGLHIVNWEKSSEFSLLLNLSGKVNYWLQSKFDLYYPGAAKISLCVVYKTFTAVASFFMPVCIGLHETFYEGLLLTFS